MNRSKLIIAVFVTLASLVPLGASACNANFTLHNNAAIPVERLFVSPSDRGRWYRDVLGADVVGSSESYYVDVNDLWTYDGTFDVRVDYANGASRAIFGVPRCSNSAIFANSDGSLAY